MATKDDVPTFDKLINPTLRALHKLGGSASIHELVDEILSDMKLPPEVAELSHGQGSQTELEYRAAWARNYLKNYGLIENSERGVWALTAAGRKAKSVDARTVLKTVQQKQREARQAREAKKQAPAEEADQVREERDWREQLLDLLQAMSPAGFERLCQRLLRESGFIEVDVTGRSGDGGIDGRGTIRIGGLISFNVLFQSKRYRGNIGPDLVRDFRGAMIGRADKGLLITTGGFTREARKEAIRDGAPPIDLIDGELLIDKLKELKLGVKTSLVEQVEVTEDWFADL
jgi:restriction system protein